jgi:hypothetical protein
MDQAKIDVELQLWYKSLPLSELPTSAQLPSARQIKAYGIRSLVRSGYEVRDRKVARNVEELTHEDKLLVPEMKVSYGNTMAKYWQERI